MTRDQLIALATLTWGTPTWTEAQIERLERFAKLVEGATLTKQKASHYQEGYAAGQRDMREKAVDVCLSVAEEYRGTTWGKAAESLGDGCAYAIRALPIEGEAR